MITVGTAEFEGVAGAIMGRKSILIETKSQTAAPIACRTIEEGLNGDAGPKLVLTGLIN